MMKKHLLLWITASFFSLLVQGQETYTLKLNPPDGSKYSSTTTTTTSTHLVQSGMDQNVEINIKYDIDASFSAMTEGANKKLSYVYDRLNMDIDAMGQHIKMSSDDNADTTNPANISLRALKGQSIHVLIDPDGKVLKVEGADEILKNAGSAPQQQEAIKGIIGEDAIKNMMGQSFGFYPKTPVKVGESWAAVMTLNQLYPIQVSADYTLTKVEGKTAFINVWGKLRTDSLYSATTNDVKVNVLLAGTFLGDIEVDINTGIPLHSTLKQKMEGEVDAGGQKVPMKIDSDIILTTVQKP